MAWLQSPDGEVHPIKGDTVSVGRDPLNDITVPDDRKISRAHAELRLRDGQWILIDLGSTNGTWVGKRRIEQHPLRGGERIRFGSTTYTYVAEPDANATQAETGRLIVGPELTDRER